MTPFLAANKFFIETRAKLGLADYPMGVLLTHVAAHFDKAKQGYRDGVMLVPIRVPEGLKTRVIKMSDAKRFITTYESRVEGETPRRKTVGVVDELADAVSATVVIYRADVLDEDNDRSSQAQWEIVTVLASAVEGGEPMTVGTLLANHFKADGGTATNMTPEAFEAALRESYNFWKDHTMAVLESEVRI